MDSVYLDDYVVINEHALKHGLTKEDIYCVWSNFLAARYRQPPNENQIVIVGPDRMGRLCQLIASIQLNGFVIYHAMQPPQKAILKELGIRGRR